MANDALLRTLDQTRFFAAEDWDQRDALRARIAQEGHAAIFHSKRLYHADAEDLAEGGVVKGLRRLGPALVMREADIKLLAQVHDEDQYSAEINGRRFVIYGPGEAEESWGLATVAFLEIVNFLIEPNNRGHRAYAVNGGNDLFVIFLPVPVFDALPKTSGYPYVPVRTPPMYGQPLEQ